MAPVPARRIDPSESQLIGPDLNGERSITHISEAAPVSLLSIMDRAIQEKMDPASLEKLFGLYERMEAGVARKAFFAAMAEFKRTCPAIPRRTENPQFKVDRNGAKVNRKFASLEDIGATVGPHLAANGLSYTWGNAVTDGSRMTMACIVSHAGGHSESSSITMPIESSAGCSVQQKVGIAETYAMRYSLIRALGLTTCDEDADGNDTGPVETISEHQADVLDSAIKETKGDKAKFLALFGIDRLEDMPASQFARATAMIDAKRRAAK